jgi:hypothetical protein
MDSKDNDALPVVVSIADNSFISSGSSENNDGDRDGADGDVNHDDDKKEVLNDGIAAMNSKATDDGESYLFNDDDDNEDVDNDEMMMIMMIMMIMMLMLMLMLMLIIDGNTQCHVF